MKDKELELSLRAAVRRKKGNDSPADRLYASLRGDLETWYRRREEAARTRKLCVPALCVMLAVAGASYWLSPVFDYHLAEGMEYEEVAMINNNILGR